MKKKQMRGLPESLSLHQLAGDSLSLHQLARTYLTAGNSPEAEKVYKKLLEMNPNDVAALAGLGALAGSSGRYGLAVQYLEKACALDSRNVVYLHNFGESLRQLGKMQQAEAVLRKVLVTDPKFAPAYQGLMAIFYTAYAQALSRKESSLAARLANEYTAVSISLGNIHLDSGLVQKAIEIYRQVLSLQPDNVTALSNLGNALRTVGQISEAEVVCRKALSIDKEFAIAWNNLGIVLNEQGRFDESLDCYKRALAIQPDFPEVVHNCGSGSLFNLLYNQDVSSQEIFLHHQRWGAAFPVPEPKRSRRTLTTGHRLRIAFLSPNFRLHAMLHFLEPILAHRDDSRFEVICYAQGPVKDIHTQRLMDYGLTWVWIHNLDDAALAEKIEQDGVDILIDCGGHTSGSGSRLKALANKPAPIMMSWLGYLGTTGLPAMDYRLTDLWVDPPGLTEALHTEHLLYIPGGMMAYRPHRVSPDVSRLPFLRNGYVTFGSLNNAQRINAQVAELWASIMRSTPDSKLLLQSKQFADIGVIGRFRGLFEAFGIKPNRLEMRTQSADFLNTYSDIDIALDTFPYGGGATTCDAIWMGVPVISLAGERPSGRLTSSILNQIGHPEWISTSAKAYFGKACELASAPETLSDIRTNLRPQVKSSVLCDEIGFVRRLEQVLLDAALQYDSACTALKFGEYAVAK